MVAGASGSLGLEVIKKLRQKGVPLRALDRSQEKAEMLRPYTDDVVIADATNAAELQGVFEDIEVLFSAVGQSVSLFTKGESFEKIDYGVNENLINAAVAAGVRRIVYVSIKGADAASGLTLADVHKRVEDLLKLRNINHTVIRPVGLFSGLNDLVIMGKQGAIPIPGSGKHKTNPIHQEDLAQVVVDVMFEGPQVLEAGGPEVFTRNQIAQMVYEKTGGRIMHIPEMLIEPGLLFIKYVDENIKDKLEFFKYVSTNDMVAPQYGKITFMDYLKNLDLNQLPDVW